MSVDEILEELRSLGSENIKRILTRHGAKEPVFGVKIEHLKKIQKRIRTDHALALALYDTGVYDAVYLAGLIVDEGKMTRKDLQKWVTRAPQPTASGWIVPWVAAESPHGHELALEWIESKKEFIAACGWATLSSLVSITPDEDLDLPELKRLLKRVAESIHDAPNRVRYQMNAFVISVGGYVASLTDLALKTAETIGEIPVDMGETACEVPLAADSIRKMQARGTIGKKRKSAKC